MGHPPKKNHKHTIYTHKQMLNILHTMSALTFRLSTHEGHNSYRLLQGSCCLVEQFVCYIILWLNPLPSQPLLADPLDNYNPK